jgi:2-keto-4-pentenoate hydratase/2-oxohepta-3-ene-1,7-dioic acid hydratase in catechol pathway
MGGNFPSHVAAATSTGMELPETVRRGTPADTPPWGFYVIPGTVVGHGATVTPPAGVRALDYEAEVAVLLCEDHPPGSTDIAIWGYTAWSDFSIRDAALGYSKTDHGPLTWSLTKNFRTGNGCGPVVVVDEPWPDAGLRIRCRVNGELRQDGRTADMTYPFGAIAAHISTYSPLEAGDLITSGTPAGTAMENGVNGRFLRNGDIVDIEMENVGVLRNQVSLPRANEAVPAVTAASRQERA